MNDHEWGSEDEIQNEQQKRESIEEQVNEIRKRMEQLVSPDFIDKPLDDQIALVGIIATRCGVLASSLTAGTEHFQPPSMWLGMFAGVALDGELVIAERIVSAIAENN